ncbi:hypothetical protein HYD97_00835 [Mycoplasmopsis bovis]|nr:hypothetical protein [Mycoplasmopsis bovis]QQH34349.1 hypothetical protein HYD97_00835 [Mycoplasmopsis bovis]
MDKLIKIDLVIVTLTIDNVSVNYKLPEIESIKEILPLSSLFIIQKKLALKMFTGLRRYYLKIIELVIALNTLVQIQYIAIV